MFEAHGPVEGKLPPPAARAALEATTVPTSVLRYVWELSDIDRDGALDADEFAVALWLCKQTLAGAPVPDKLPPACVPPSKR